jgi:hypothetical protein
MSKLSDFAHKAASLVVDTDEEAPKSVAPVRPAAPAPHPAFDLNPSTYSAAAPATGFSPAPGNSPFAVPSTQVLDEKVYQSVLKKTNFDDTPVGKAVHKYFDALMSAIPDQTQRFKAAIAQAQSLDNITPQQVLDTFDQLAAALDRDAQGFAGLAASFDKNEIGSRQDKIAAKQAQVTQLNQEIAQLQGELTDQQSSHANAVSQYGLAAQRRAQEIAAQKAQFAALLH